MQPRPARLAELNQTIFATKPNPVLLAQAVRVQQLRMRQGTRKTKGRGEVRGGGRKPWRQKGLGRARHGSIRSPIWVGGGHAHPLTPLVRWARLPKKMRRAALFSALGTRLAQGGIFLLDELKLNKISTKAVNQLIQRWQLQWPILLVLPQPVPEVVLSVRNLPNVSAIEARRLNAVDVLKARQIVLVNNALKVLEETFL